MNRIAQPQRAVYTEVLEEHHMGSSKPGMPTDRALVAVIDGNSENRAQLDQRLLKMFREMLLDATCVDWA